MPTTHESVCCTEIGQLWQKVEEQGPETQISCITEHPGFQSICLDGCWRRPITRTGSSKAQIITQASKLNLLNVFCFICFILHFEIVLLELFLSLI